MPGVLKRAASGDAGVADLRCVLARTGRSRPLRAACRLCSRGPALQAAAVVKASVVGGLLVRFFVASYGWAHRCHVVPALIVRVAGLVTTPPCITREQQQSTPLTDHGREPASNNPSRLAPM